MSPVDQEAEGKASRGSHSAFENAAGDVNSTEEKAFLCTRRLQGDSAEREQGSDQFRPVVWCDVGHVRRRRRSEGRKHLASVNALDSVHKRILAPHYLVNVRA